MKFKKLLVNLSLLLGVSVFCLLVLELGLRLLSSQPISRKEGDPDLGWYHVPNTSFLYSRQEFRVRVDYNSWGMRDTKHQSLKPPGVYRIAVLGDSFIEGREVVLDSVYSKVLERHLRQKGVSCETLNFGVNGYGNDQELMLLKKYALRFEPDLVILAFCKNDLLNNLITNMFSLTPEGQLQYAPIELSFASKVRAWLWGNSYLFVFLNVKLPRMMGLGTRTGGRARNIFGGDWLGRWGDNIDVEQDIGSYLMPVYAKVENQLAISMKSLTEAILLEFHRVCRENGSRLVLLVVNSRFQIRPQEWEQALSRYGLDPEAYDPEAVDRWLVALATREGIPVINCAQRFRQLKTLKLTKFHYDIDGHWNNNGHREAARLTADFLETSGFLPVASLKGPKCSGCCCPSWIESVLPRAGTENISESFNGITPFPQVREERGGILQNPYLSTRGNSILPSFNGVHLVWCAPPITEQQFRIDPMLSKPSRIEPTLFEVEAIHPFLYI